ncbi:MAG: 50S ribosomal protein L29 [Synergistales bacterium]|jgi:large subunit ribosomal protein L29|nr:50S ribosomal protein L29 [Bacteroidales bacterium]MDY6434863.1 50S ribosomal protein L29 [Synergistales bacterium]MBQ6753662.1 50S ribosomal protein L29 [Bacteroidales bacterium]MDY6381412.1 50S ribosomal protein L29 [Bacteroidales bacterium]MDY6394248.1 50S ribosomal protein L29 [Bacteroidales bacterium]
MKNNLGLKELSDKELQERLEAEQMQLVKMKINHAVSPLENPNLLATTRKNIARINTEISLRRKLANENK